MDRRRKVRGERDTSEPLRIRFGVLKTSLNGAIVSYGMIQPTSADVWFYDEQIDDIGSNPDLLQTMEYESCSNLNPDMSGIAGQACAVELVNGIWRFIWVQKTPPTAAADCACCDCMTCIDAAHASVGVSTYGSSWVAPNVYFVQFGAWVKYPELGVFDYLIWDSGATWKGRVRRLVYGGCCAYYQYIMVEDGDNSYVELVWVSGCDPLALLTGGTKIKWTAETNWSPLCNSSFKAINPEKFPFPPLGLHCKICVQPIMDPVGGEGGFSGCTPCDFPTFDPLGAYAFHVSIPAVDFSTVPAQTIAGHADLWVSWVGLYPASSLISPCTWHADSGVGNPWQVDISIGGNKLTATITTRILPFDPFHPYDGFASARYSTPWSDYACPFAAELGVSSITVLLDVAHADSSGAWPSSLQLGVGVIPATSCEDCSDCAGLGCLSGTAFYIAKLSDDGSSFYWWPNFDFSYAGCPPPCTFPSLSVVNSLFGPPTVAGQSAALPCVELP